MNIRGIITTVKRIGLYRTLEYMYIRNNKDKLSKVYTSKIGFKFIPYTRHGYLYYNFYHEPVTLKWLIKNLKNYDYFVNIGAGYGEYSLLAAYFNLEVYAYEPHPILYKYFQGNIELNNFKRRIKAFNKAVFQTPSAILYEPVANTTSSYIKGYGRIKEGEVVKYKVKASTLNELHRLSGNILWLIDVEGAECNVLNLISKKYLYNSDFIIEVDSLSEICTSSILGGTHKMAYLDHFNQHKNILWILRGHV